MTPIVFEGNFGWLHEASGTTGVLLCGAQGYEQLCAHRAWRILAEDIAALGFPTMRLDYGGAGDSLRGDRDSDRLADWLASTRLAIAELKARTGVNRVVMVGLRLGASFAAQIAAEDGGIGGLVMLAPVATRRAYVRELSVFSKMQAQPGERPAHVRDEPGLEVQGFWLSPETQDALRSIDLVKLSRSPAAKILLVAPDEHPSTETIATHFGELGASVERAPFPSYAQFIADPTFSRFPSEAFQTVKDWLGREFAGNSSTAPESAGAPAQNVIAGDDFIEEPILFGPEKRLFGMLCRARRPAPDAPTLLFVNAGANPHIGWARMTVESARAFAALGVSSFRIDVAGLGDSAAIPGRKSQVMYSMETISDVSAALDLLTDRGLANFYIVGLCSGAHLAFHSAIADSRIQVLVMANLQKFIWQDGYSLEVAVRNAYRSNTFYKDQAFRADTWKRLLRGEIKVLGISKTIIERLCRIAAARVEGVMGALEIGPPNDVTRVRRWFKTLSARGVRLLLVYSSSDGGLDEIAQFMGVGGRQVEKLPGASLSIIQGGDHNVTPRWARDQMFGLMKDFVKKAVR